MSRTDHPGLPHRKGANAHRVGHARRSYREHGRGDYVDWGTPRGRRPAMPSVTGAESAEGLAEIGLDEPRTCRDLGAENDLECQRIKDNLDHADLMEDLTYTYDYE